MMFFPKTTGTIALALALAACSKSDGSGNTTAAAPERSAPKLGIRPYGDETIKINKAIGADA